MGALIIGVVFAAIVIGVVFVRNRFRVNDRSAIYCPRSESVVEIRDGVCRDARSRRIVGVAPVCARECLMPRAGDTWKREECDARTG